MLNFMIRVINLALTLAIYQFYRLTRMHSADYAVARGLSVRLSVTICRYYVYHQIFHYSSFSAPNGMAIFRRGPPNGASNAEEYEKNHDFRPISRYIFTMEGE